MADRYRRMAVLAVGLLMTEALTGAAVASAAPASGPVHTWRGDQAGERFGWAVSGCVTSTVTGCRM